MSPTPQRPSHASRSIVWRQRGFAALALAISALHFASFDVTELPIASDVRYFLYFAWRIAEGALPHVDLFDNKTFLASFAGALCYRLGAALGIEPLYAIRAGFLAIAALGGWLAFFIHRRLGGGHPAAGLLGLLAYCAFGLIGLLAATGPLPKLLMAVLASAMALLVLRRRWLAAGAAGGLAFLDWQVGGLVWLAALASALLFGAPRARAALRVACGGALALSPFAGYYAARGGLGAALEQTLLASFFRGASTLARRDLGARLDRIEQVVAWGSAGRGWLVYAGLAVGIPVALAWLWRARGRDEARLLVPLCLCHFGILAFSAVDFQGYGDLALALQSVAFLLALVWVALYAGLRGMLARLAPRAVPVASVALVLLAAAVARPAWWRPPLVLTLRDEPVRYTLADQREVAETVAELTAGRTLLFLDASEQLFLTRHVNALPVIFWNDAVWGSLRTGAGESQRETAERLVREVRPGVLAWHRRLGDSPLLAEYDFRRVEASSGRYGVNLWLRPQPPPLDVLLISVDTLRADHLGAYAPGDATTPHIDRLAAEGTLFERAVAPMPLTRPTHASLLTSRYPREHGVLNNRIALPEAERTLTEMLREQGYRTAGFVGVKLLGADSGLAQAFETFESPDEPRERPAPEVVSDALAWLATLRSDERFFLWLHLFDPHVPYAPPPDALDALDPALASRLPAVDWPVLQRIAAENGGDVPRPVLEHARALYRGEVRVVDRALGRLLEGVSALRDLDDALVVFTADHGECFEHGVYFEHADCLFEGAIHVPLIVRLPRAFPPATRVTAPASSVDVVPTVLRALGLEIPDGLSGRPLQTLADDASRWLLVQHPFYQPDVREGRALRWQTVRSVAGDPVTPLLLDAEQVGIVGRDWKYLRTGEREELYVLAPEADEGVNLAAERPELSARLRAILEAELARRPMRLIDPGRIDEELLETLRALGYAD